MSGRHLLLALPLLALTALAAGGCGGGDPSGGDPEKAVFAAELDVGDLSDRTRWTKTSTGLFARDLQVGSGTTVVPGMTVSVWYSGFLTDGTVFDERQPSAGASAVPPGFVIGAGRVIVGWDQGFVGLGKELAPMKVGGRRQLVIPSNLAYGTQGRGAIPPNAVLVFNVELVSVK
jgi:FKBP-type peptidyl-prolyl cis-trans isomerase